jgi:hypothetical protein
VAQCFVRLRVCGIVPLVAWGAYQKLTTRWLVWTLAFKGMDASRVYPYLRYCVSESEYGLTRMCFVGMSIVDLAAYGRRGIDDSRFRCVTLGWILAFIAC